MTNLEVLKGSISGNFTDIQLNIALTKQGLSEADEYNQKNELKIDLSIASLLFLTIGSAQSVSELDYSVTSRSTSDIMDAIKAIYAKWGLPNPYANDKIKGSNVW